MGDLIEIVVPKIKPVWDEVAYSLDFDVYFVEATTEEFHDFKKRCKKVFIKWLTTSHGPTPKTWQTLLSKLRSIEELVAASENIEKQLMEKYN